MVFRQASGTRKNLEFMLILLELIIIVRKTNFKFFFFSDILILLNEPAALLHSLKAL